MNTKQFCKKYLNNYTINPDDTIDVDGRVDLYDILDKMEKLPVKFEKVSGYFTCYGNNLTTLEGCPNYVGRKYSCGANNLTSLEYCPKYVGDNFYSDIITHHILGNVQCEIYYYKKKRIVI
jgi:hypothetical protein